ncbi:Bug family tripartite tricarboxylate transporter substrate binding protein [Leisingera sp.]|uniref:Bug family tripartite tricarboxylate transporter substrate binding protein n=1 Tax=Leisingera sp. TaxID=1879318 RepID=UPI003A913C15
MNKILTKWIKRVAGAALLATSIGGQPALANEYPLDQVTLMVPYSTGGSLDRMARATAPFISEELGKPVVVMNKPGGGGVLGHTWFKSQPADGSMYMVTAATPHLATQILTDRGDYEWETFDFLNAQWADYYIIVVNKDQPYHSLSDLVEALKANPGSLSAGIVQGSGGHLAMLLLLEALDLPSDAIRFVTYDGGGAVRTALAGNQTALGVFSARGTEPVRENVRALAVLREEASQEWDAPAVNDELAAFNASIPLISADVRTVAAHPDLSANHPERVDLFLAAYKRALERQDVQAKLAEVGIRGDWRGPAETQALLDENFEVLSGLAGALK